RAATPVTAFTESKAYTGGESVDSGDWTEVSYRRRKALREADGGQERLKQNLRYQGFARSFSSPGDRSFDGDRPASFNHARDNDPYVRFQTRCNKEHNRNCRRSISLQRRRSPSAGANRKPVLFRRQQEGRWHSKDTRRPLDSPNRRRRHDDSEQRKHSVDRRYRFASSPRWQHQFDESSLRCRDERWYQQGNDKVGGFVGGDGVDHHVLGNKTMLGTDLRRNVSKLLRALNNVRFGNFCVRARVASFDRNDLPARPRMDTESLGLAKGLDKSAMNEGKGLNPRSASSLGNEAQHASLGAQAKKGVVSDAVPVKGNLGAPRAVRVGAIEVSLGARKDKVTLHKDKAQEERPTNNFSAVPEAVIREKDRQVLMRSYRTEPIDEKWAQNGLVATILNGEAVPVVQGRLTDAGFSDVALIPMGADKVFVRCLSGIDVSAVVNDAKGFFRLIFSSWTRWGSLVEPYKRGAWVRLYGVPLQAWNSTFFKLCVLECGRFLRLDNCSLEKGRLDFARVLIATSDLEVINKVETVLVDGIQVAGQGDPEARRHIDAIVENLAKGLEAEDDVGSHENFQQYNDGGDMEGDSKAASEVGEHRSVLGVKHGARSTGRVTGLGVFSPSTAGQDSLSICSPIDDNGRPGGDVGHVGPRPTQSGSKRVTSCPPCANRSVFSGPWSVEWLHDMNQGEAGVIFSAGKRPRKGECSSGGRKISGEEDPKKIRGRGVFRHTLSSLKKVARMPSDDRFEVLKALKKKERSRNVGVGVPQACDVRHQVSSTMSSSTASATNDWQHWVVMQGDEKVVADDVREVGEAIGVHLKGDAENMFSALTRKGVWGGWRRGRRFVGWWGSNNPFCCVSKKLSCNLVMILFVRLCGVEVWSSESCESVLWCHGRFVRSGEEFYVANIYAPCDSRAKQALWDSLSLKIQALGRARVCLCGDFNAVRSADERLSARDGVRSSDHVPFNRFIEENTLIDLPLGSRKFTWFKGDGRSMSRLDRFLLSGDWCLSWPNYTQVARMRGLSDHCPLVLAA
ncbi:cysteine-rich receptor-like protein kinase, partial [Trifolium pratense]